MKKKICHLTSVHRRYDTRIFLKQCTSLAKEEDFEVYLVVADGIADEVKNNISIIDVGKEENRYKRITKSPRNILNKALELDCDVYHIHDFELLTIARKLQRKGKKVIFDSHEDFPEQMLDKPYLNKFFLKIISKASFFYEKRICSKLDYIVTATPFIKNKFLKINKSSLDINNYPIIGELRNTTKWKERKCQITFVGVISEIRGIREVVKALEFDLPKEFKLNLVGDFSDKQLLEELKEEKGWKKHVNYLGFKNRKEVSNILKESKAGLVTFHKAGNHINAQPNKMFEYMSAGLPVISSNFDLWRSIIEGNNCGICVNPNSPEEIAKAINQILKNDVNSDQMSKNGILAIQQKYNWFNEEKKILKVYKHLLND